MVLHAETMCCRFGFAFCGWRRAWARKWCRTICSNWSERRNNENYDDRPTTESKCIGSYRIGIKPKTRDRSRCVASKTGFRVIRSEQRQSHRWCDESSFYGNQWLRPTSNTHIVNALAPVHHMNCARINHKTIPHFVKWCRPAYEHEHEQTDWWRVVGRNPRVQLQSHDHVHGNKFRLPTADADDDDGIFWTRSCGESFCSSSLSLLIPHNNRLFCWTLGAVGQHPFAIYLSWTSENRIIWIFGQNWLTRLVCVGQMKLFECIIIIVVAEFGTNDRPTPLTPFDGDINEKTVANFSAGHSPMHRECDGFAVHANRSMLIYDIPFRWLLNGSVNLLNSLQRQSGLSPHWIWTIEPHTNHLNVE